MPLDRAPGVRLVCFGHVGAVRLLSPPPLLPLPGREPVRAAGSRERVTASRPDLRHPSSSVSSLLLPIRRTSRLCLETSRSHEAPSGSPSAASSLPSRERTQSPARRRDRRRRSRLTAVGALAPAAGSVPASRVLPHVCECAGVCVCTHTRMCTIARERTACERLQARTHARG